VVPLLGLEINTASFAMYTFSLAVLIQALTLISFSALADYGMIETGLIANIKIAIRHES
jgi:UMF1 family MFS transporter